ncbi:hypothetical protein DRO91_05605, partial [Candidatus Heimdallarchaeota archaeon]
LTGFSALSKTRYFYISKDATWKLLDTSFAEVDTGSFAFFPVKIRARNRVDKDNGVATYTATTEISEVQPEMYFQFPSGALTGNVTVNFNQLTTGVFGFLENIYDSNKVSYKQVAETSLFNQTVYMLTTARSKEVKVTTVDRGEGAIANTLVVFNILVDDVWQVFSSGFTDGTGIVKFNLDEDETYLVTLSATGFSPQSFTITQSEDEYKFYLSDQFQFFEQPLDNLAMSLTPTETSIYTNTSYWFNYTVVDGNTQTDYIKLTLEDQDNNVLFSQTTSGNPSGGLITEYLTTTNETEITANMTVKRFLVDEVLIQRRYTVFAANVSSISLSEILPDFQDANTTGGWNMLVLFSTLIFSLMHPLIGIVWLFLLAAANVLNIYIAIVGLFAMIGGVAIRS